MKHLKLFSGFIAGLTAAVLGVSSVSANAAIGSEGPDLIKLVKPIPITFITFSQNSRRVSTILVTPSIKLSLGVLALAVCRQALIPRDAGL